MVNSYLCHQIIAVSAAVLGAFSLGNIFGLTTILIPELQSDHSDFTVDNDQASWIASSRSLTSILGSIIIPYVMTVRGRRVAHVCNQLITAISYVVLFTAHSFPPCAVASLLQGFTFGGSVILDPVIVAECTSPAYRGIFNCVLVLATAFGVLYVHFIGAYLHWRTITLLLEISVLLSIAMTPFWKDSPYWLASRGRLDECEDAFYWYRGYDKEAIDELKSLKEKERRHLIGRSKATSVIVHINLLFKKITQRDFLRPIAVVLVACSFLDLTGRGVIVAYSIQILDNLGVSGSNAYLIIFIMDCCGLIGIGASVVCSKLLKRRHHLFLSAGLCVACLALASCCHRLRVEGLLPEYWRWASAAMLCGFMFACALGTNAIPIILLGELLPVRHQGAALPVVGIYASLAQFSTVKSGLSMLNTLGVDGLLGLYGELCLVFLIILYFIQPETQHKTLMEIERLYSRGSNVSAPSPLLEPANRVVPAMREYHSSTYNEVSQIYNRD